MSLIYEHRARVIDALKDKIPELREVEWYDGMFDAEDIAEWLLKAPSAFVSVRTGAIRPHSTGELNATLRFLVTVVCEDEYKPRDADTMCWTILEKIMRLVSYNNFGDLNAGKPERLKAERISIPEMRRQGVFVGVAEWEITVTIGDNKMYEREFFFHPNTGAELPVPSTIRSRLDFLGHPVESTAHPVPSETVATDILPEDED